MRRSKLVLLIGGCLLMTFASWSADLSQSTLDAVLSLANFEYEALKEEAAKNPKKLFIEHLLQKPKSSWAFILKRAFTERKITPIDLLYISSEDDFNFSPIRIDSPFTMAIMDSLKKNEKVADMIKLFSEPQIERRLGYRGPDLKLNFLAALVEDGHSTAFEAIVDGCPEYEHNPFANVAVIATSMVDDPENLGIFLNGKKLETVEYNLASWLMRDEQIYLVGRYAKPSYVKAGQALLLFAQKRFGLEMSPAGIVPLAQFFEKHKLLPEGFDYNSFAELKGIKLAEAAKEAEPAAGIASATPVPTNSLAEPEGEDSLETKPFYQPLMDFMGL